MVFVMTSAGNLEFLPRETQTTRGFNTLFII
jgi:hypothetical protein